MGTSYGILYPEILYYKDWMIGNLKDIGEGRRGINSVENLDHSILDVANNKWYYYHDDDFQPIPAGDIIISCVQGT